MTRAVIYRRVSTAEQAKSRLGIESQATLCRALVDEFHAELVDVFTDEGVSASIPIAERPAGRQMCDLLAGGGVDMVVALDQERLFRDTIDTLATIRRWREIAVDVVLVDGGEVGVADPEGFLEVAIKAVIGEYSLLQTRRRTLRACEAARARGEFIGATPYGFQPPREEAGRKIRANVDRVDDNEQAVIRRIKLLRRPGNRFSYRAIAGILEQEGVPTRRGGRWQGETVRKIAERSV
jgi:DNA invertase Pin-like site-specific DNA recombinase